MQSWCPVQEEAGAPQVEEHLPAKRRRGKPKGRYLDDHLPGEQPGDTEEEDY